MGAFLLFFGLQFANYLVITLNIRAIGAEEYAWAAATDVCAALLAWAVIERIARAPSWPAKAGYLTGAATASMVGIWLTRAWQ